MKIFKYLAITYVTQAVLDKINRDLRWTVRYAKSTVELIDKIGKEEYLQAVSANRVKVKSNGELIMVGAKEQKNKIGF